MSWVYVSRFMKTQKNRDSLQDVLDRNLEHWRGVALDLGFDPEKNVRFEDGQKVATIAISEAMDLTLREEPGEWR